VITAPKAFGPIDWFHTGKYLDVNMGQNDNGRIRQPIRVNNKKPKHFLEQKVQFFPHEKHYNHNAHVGIFSFETYRMPWNLQLVLHKL